MIDRGRLMIILLHTGGVVMYNRLGQKKSRFFTAYFYREWTTSLIQKFNRRDFLTRITLEDTHETQVTHSI